MKTTELTALAAMVMALSFNSASAGEASPGKDAVETPESEVDIGASKDGTDPSRLADELADFCFFAGTPSPEMKFTTIRKLKVGKGTYGGIKEILPKLAQHARKVGADAIIQYNGSQRFGFFPWRMVRPVVTGVAIKWVEPKKTDCAAMGGAPLKLILTEDKPPSQ